MHCTHRAVQRMFVESLSVRLPCPLPFAVVFILGLFLIRGIEKSLEGRGQANGGGAWKDRNRIFRQDLSNRQSRVSCRVIVMEVPRPCSIHFRFLSSYGLPHTSQNLQNDFHGHFFRLGNQIFVSQTWRSARPLIVLCWSSFALTTFVPFVGLSLYTKLHRRKLDKTFCEIPPLFFPPICSQTSHKCFAPLRTPHQN